MTLKARRVLSAIFILLFLTITPAIVLYAAGFKLSKNGFSIQKTGMFVVDSYPRGAKVYLNGQSQKTFFNLLTNKNNFITTPAKIKNLLPGEYELKIELDGYSGWQKKLTINPGASTFAEDIYLFKDDLPIQIFSSKIQSINLSPDKNQALIFSAGRFALFNLADETEKLSGENDLPGKNIAWSADGQKIIIDNYLFNSSDLKEKTDLSEILPNGYNFKWQGNEIYFQDKTSIYRLDADNRPVKIFSGMAIGDFLVKTDYLYLINQPEPAAVSLEIINLASGEQIYSLNLPISPDYAFINPEQDLLNLYDGQHNLLYLIEPPEAHYPPRAEILDNIKTAFWVDGENLLYTNDFEIWLYNLPARKKTLITRVGETISQAAMQPNKNFIIYSTGQTLNAVELDERQKRNTAELVKFDSIGSFFFGSRSEVIYFSGKIGQAQGLYKMLMQ